MVMPCLPTKCVLYACTLQAQVVCPCLVVTICKWIVVQEATNEQRLSKIVAWAEMQNQEQLSKQITEFPMQLGVQLAEVKKLQQILNIQKVHLAPFDPAQYLPTPVAKRCPDQAKTERLWHESWLFIFKSLHSFCVLSRLSFCLTRETIDCCHKGLLQFNSMFWLPRIYCVNFHMLPVLAWTQMKTKVAYLQVTTTTRFW